MVVVAFPETRAEREAIVKTGKVMIKTIDAMRKEAGKLALDEFHEELMRRLKKVYEEGMKALKAAEKD